MSGKELINRNRGLMKQLDWEEMLTIAEPDQRKGVPPPSPQKPYPEDATLIELVRPENMTLGKIPLIGAIIQRRSRRNYTEESLSIQELSFLLWSTQGVQQVLNRGRTMRTVPAGGALHPFETYLIVSRVEGLQPGVYRYLALEHRLFFLSRGGSGLSERVKEAIPGEFVSNAAVLFIWAAIPYRKEWRYSIIAFKDILIDARHVCQNLYLSCEAVGAGTCAILSYDQKKTDAIIGVDGKDEFTLYIASVGKVPHT